jgi:hypothetical protein
MPYVKQEEREYLGWPLEQSSENGGQLNFQITQLILDYYNRNGQRYQQINDVLGALEGAKLEFYRRVAAPYEDKKIKENGDVF